MAETRVKGQDTVIRISRSIGPEVTVTAIKNLTITLDMTTLDEGYLGETTNRKDDIFTGVSGSFDVHHEGDGVYALIAEIKARSQRAPQFALQTSSINLSTQLFFPNGDAPRILIPDLKFDSIPINMGGRDAYVMSTFSFKAADLEFVVT